MRTITHSLNRPRPKQRTRPFRVSSRARAGADAPTGTPVQQRVLFRITRFDRPRFVNEITDAVRQHEHCRIRGMTFEGDGVRVTEWLMVEVPDARHVTLFDQRIRTLQGLVQLQQIN